MLNYPKRNQFHLTRPPLMTTSIIYTGELKLNIINKLDMKSVLSNGGSERDILYSCFCIAGFVLLQN